MKTATDHLLEEAAQRAGSTVKQVLSDAGKEFPKHTPLATVINHVAGNEYEQQQKDLAQCG